MSKEERPYEMVLRFNEDGVDACYKNKAFVSCATLIFIYSEAFGAFIRGRRGESGRQDMKFLIQESFNDFMKNIKQLEVCVEFIDGKEKKWWGFLYNYYRNGLAHGGMMKVGSGLNQGDPYFSLGEGKVMIISIDRLYRDYKSSVKNIREKLKFGNIRSKFDDRLEWILGIKSDVIDEGFRELEK